MFWGIIHTHTHLTALFPGLPRWTGARKVEPIWILLKQETVSGSGISWARCKSTPSSRPTTTPVSRHSLFYRPDALPAAQPQRQSIEGICLQCFWGIIVLLNFAAYNKLLNNGFTYRTLMGSHALPDRLHYQGAALMTRGALHLFLLPECTVCFTKDMWAEELHYNKFIQFSSGFWLPGNTGWPVSWPCCMFSSWCCTCLLFCVYACAFVTRIKKTRLSRVI